MKYKLSKEGIDDLIRSEGLRLKRYRDTKGLWTHGIGHLITPEELHTQIIKLSTGERLNVAATLTYEQVVQLFRDDLVRFRKSVNKLREHINQGQFDALVSFAFNVGVGAFERSTAYRYVFEDRHSEVPDALMMWVIPKSLTSRRRREASKYEASTQNITSDIELTDAEYNAALELLSLNA